MESKSLLSEFKIINNKNVLIKVIDGSLNNLMNLYDSLKVKLNDYIICLIGNDSLKHPLLIGVSDSYVKNGIKANILIKEIGKILEVSESRVCQLHSRAIRKLREKMQAMNYL